MDKSKYKALDQLCGRQLGSVEFVQDYLQLRFDGPTINVMTPIVVIAGPGAVRSGDDQFRNALCGQITKIVRTVKFREATSLEIEFEDESRISVSLLPDDYRCAEAVYFHGFENGEWGVA